MSGIRLITANSPPQSKLKFVLFDLFFILNTLYLLYCDCDKMSQSPYKGFERASNCRTLFTIVWQKTF
jgi:hypothetical protein